MACLNSLRAMSYCINTALAATSINSFMHGTVNMLLQVLIWKIIAYNCAMKWPCPTLVIRYPYSFGQAGMQGVRQNLISQCPVACLNAGF